MYLLFDIGGTKMRVTISKDGQAFGGPKIVETPQQFEDGAEQMKLLVHQLADNNKIAAAAGGIAGPLNDDKSELINAPHLPDWVGQPIQQELEKIIGAPVYLENDTALVGLGEATVGSGRGLDIVAYMTVSTGVGGVRIVNRRIDRSTIGFEPGHQILAMGEENQKSVTNNVRNQRSESGAEERKLKAQSYFTLENLVSGAAVERRYQQKPAEITDQRIWDELAYWLAIGLNNTIVHWSPQVVVLGGSMIVKDVGIKLDQVKLYLQEILTIFPERPMLKQATLGDFGGLHGGLAYLRQKEKNDVR